MGEYKPTFEEAAAVLNANILQVQRAIAASVVPIASQIELFCVALASVNIPPHVRANIEALPEPYRTQAMRRALVKTLLSVIPDSKHGKRKWASKHAGKKWGQKRQRKGAVGYRAHWRNKLDEPLPFIYTTGNFLPKGEFSIGYTTWDSPPFTWGEVESG